MCSLKKILFTILLSMALPVYGGSSLYVENNVDDHGLFLSLIHLDGYRDVSTVNLNKTEGGASASALSFFVTTNNTYLVTFKSGIRTYECYGYRVMTFTKKKVSLGACHPIKINRGVHAEEGSQRPSVSEDLKSSIRSKGVHQ